MSVATVAYSSGLPLSHAPEQALADSNSSSSGSVNSCGEDIPPVLAIPQTIRPTVVTKDGHKVTNIFSKDTSVIYHLFVVNSRNISEIKLHNTNTLILQPIWVGNPDCASNESVQRVIAENRIFLRAIFTCDANKFEIFHNSSLNDTDSENIKRVVIADLDTEAQLKLARHNVKTVAEGKATKRKIVCCLNDRFNSQIDRTKYTSSDAFDIMKEQFLNTCQSFNFGSIDKQIAADVNNALKKQCAFEAKLREEHRKQEADDLATDIAISSLLAAGTQSQAYGRYVAPTVTPQQARMLVNAQSKDNNDNQCTLQ